jgi:carbonic anhydrase/acetyltransferase-like protein (isoleucine patch superfamily)
MLYRLGEKQPVLEGEGHYIAPNASVIGSVTLGANTSIWFNAVIRADEDLIRIGAGSNIQDGAVLHVDPGCPLDIGERVTVGHKAMLHGCTIGDGSLIGINAVILNGARIGKACLVGANALVPENMEVPDGAMVIGTPGKVKRMLSAEEQAMVKAGADHYIAGAAAYAKLLQETDASG